LALAIVNGIKLVPGIVEGNQKLNKILVQGCLERGGQEHAIWFNRPIGTHLMFQDFNSFNKKQSRRVDNGSIGLALQ